MNFLLLYRLPPTRGRLWRKKTGGRYNPLKWHANDRLCVLLVMSQVKPLIWIESVIEKHSHSRIEYMIKVNSDVCLPSLYWGGNL